MKIQSIISIAAAGATMIKGATTATFLIGLMYLVDCRISNRKPADIDRCWMTALPIMGIGGVGRGAFEVGLQSPVPTAKREDQRGGILGGRRQS
jgi:hypothetical protein